MNHYSWWMICFSEWNGWKERGAGCCCNCCCCCFCCNCCGMQSLIVNLQSLIVNCYNCCNCYRCCHCCNCCEMRVACYGFRVPCSMPLALCPVLPCFKFQVPDCALLKLVIGYWILVIARLLRLPCTHIFFGLYTSKDVSFLRNSLIYNLSISPD